MWQKFEYCCTVLWWRSPAIGRLMLSIFSYLDVFLLGWIIKDFIFLKRQKWEKSQAIIRILNDCNGFFLFLSCNHLRTRQIFFLGPCMNPPITGSRWNEKSELPCYVLLRVHSLLLFSLYFPPHSDSVSKIFWESYRNCVATRQGGGK